MENNNNQTFFKVALGVTVGVIALLSYLFIGARNETFELQKALTTKVEQLSSTQIKLDSISKSLDEKIKEVEMLGGNVAELEKVKAQLESDKKKLKSDLSFSTFFPITFCPKTVLSGWEQAIYPKRKSSSS